MNKAPEKRADKKVYAALFDGILNAVPNFNESKLRNIKIIDWVFALI